ncbi:Cytochrome C oxidase, mono-heme subunit/FixO [Pelagimonas phthalicica]|uniref:Cytochrome C oxidase, mono-heme subunit/FixO n=1 Tax=Pelagimonas phthalicica TaxID=1037362 RepID=A0A238JFX7_9RHOB|nr:cytochrome-c oxidase, cbb3-type subunit II [Pelagimonas phthalicica]TDS92254.1 cytochrome c oxidase cbb3-type subunit 2 [Pelagimonas phthalicica]SMX29315.1 Cytochrome C oxidase, mono-heme subunit/FixO [Pelagimonas phthalicica]
MDHAKLERNGIAFALAILGVASIGGIIEIAPLFTIENTIEEAPGMRPYTPLELAGHNIYVREGCYACHSQMVRTLRSDVDRYGHFSLAAESMYDHPHQWGSKRTGPDLARVGQKYSDDWHVAHLAAPRAVVQGSVMPGYPFLSETRLDTRYFSEALTAQVRVGVPYTEEQIANAAKHAAWQADPEAEYEDDLIDAYGDKVQIRDFDGNPNMVSEMDALVAYLQVLGTLVDFDALNPEEIAR